MRPSPPAEWPLLYTCHEAPVFGYRPSEETPILALRGTVVQVSVASTAVDDTAHLALALEREDKAGESCVLWPFSTTPHGTASLGGAIGRMVWVILGQGAATQRLYIPSVELLAQYDAVFKEVRRAANPTKFHDQIVLLRYRRHASDLPPLGEWGELEIPIPRSLEGCVMNALITSPTVRANLSVVIGTKQHLALDRLSHRVNNLPL